MNVTATIREIGSCVCNKRVMLLLTQRDLALMAGVSERLIRSLEAGEASGIGLDMLLAILGVLDMTIELSDYAVSAEPDLDQRYSEILKGVVSYSYFGAEMSEASHELTSTQRKEGLGPVTSSGS